MSRKHRFDFSEIKMNTLLLMASMLTYETYTDIEGNEYVLCKALNDGIRKSREEYMKKGMPTMSGDYAFLERTQYEADNNEESLLEFNRNDYRKACKLGHMIALAIKKALEHDYPSKEFHIYVIVNWLALGGIPDINVRFHQTWEGEEPYFTEFEQGENSMYKDTRVYYYKTERNIVGNKE